MTPSIFYYMKEKVKDLYNTVRSNPKKANEVISEALKLEKSLRKEEVKNSRLMSLISLKNDLILQSSLTEENIDSYLEDLRYCIDEKIYLAKDSSLESPFKIFEMIAKIQYAYNLLESKKSVRKIYENFLEEYNKDFDNYFKLFKNKTIIYSNYQLIFTYSIPYLFLDEYFTHAVPILGKKSMNTLAKADKFYDAIINNMMLYLKENKMNFYGIKSYKKMKRESLTKYNFIY